MPDIQPQDIERVINEHEDLLHMTQFSNHKEQFPFQLSRYAECLYTTHESQYERRGVWCMPPDGALAASCTFSCCVPCSFDTAEGIARGLPFPECFDNLPPMQGFIPIRTSTPEISRHGTFPGNSMNTVHFAFARCSCLQHHR